MKLAVYCLTLAALLLAAVSPAAASSPTSSLLPLQVHAGRCSFVLPASRPGEKYYLVIGSLARSSGLHHVTIRTTPHPGAVELPVARDEPDAAWRQSRADPSARPAPARRSRSIPSAYPPAEPPLKRVFHLPVKDRDFQDRASYAAVTGRLRAVGRHVQVYVDDDDANSEGLCAAVADAVKTFDDAVYPEACRTLGHPLDVDRDGRFTILFSGRLGKLGSGRSRLDGFVRGSDFYRDQAAPFGNRCDMLYLNSALRPGPHLRTVLAHEYTHAIVFCEHVLTDYQPNTPRREEECWLNEALAHLTESRHGFGWSNLDYRVSAFLNAPERYSLVVPDYHAAGLWRSHGHRGAAYLFLRWCADQYGTELTGRLAQTNLSRCGQYRGRDRRTLSRSFPPLDRIPGR